MNMDDQVQIEILDTEIERLENILNHIKTIVEDEKLTKGETYDKIAKILQAYEEVKS